MPPLFVSGDSRALSLRLFSEIASMFLNQQQFDGGTHKASTKKLHQLITDTVLPQ